MMGLIGMGNNPMVGASGSAGCMLNSRPAELPDEWGSGSFYG